MKKLVLFFAVLTLSGVLMAQNNVVTYTADEKLRETDIDIDPGLHTNAFGGASIIGHTFSDGVGTITFDRDLTIIDSRAFFNATVNELSSIVIPATVTSIGWRAFYNCKELSVITFAEGSQLTTFTDMCFFNCDFAQVTLPATVDSIGPGVFANNEHMTLFTCLATTPPGIANSIFQYDDALQ